MNKAAQFLQGLQEVKKENEQLKAKLAEAERRIKELEAENKMLEQHFKEELNQHLEGGEMMMATLQKLQNRIKHFEAAQPSQDSKQIELLAEKYYPTKVYEIGRGHPGSPYARIKAEKDAFIRGYKERIGQNLPFIVYYPDNKEVIAAFQNEQWAKEWKDKYSATSIVEASVVPTGIKEDDVTSTNNSSKVPCDAPLKDNNSI